MSDAQKPRKQGRRCDPGCVCGRHKQHRWPERTAEERFWEKVQKTDGCWLWTGYLVKGYGSLKIGSKNTLAHRYSFELANGPIPPRMSLDHNFDCPKNCVNPDHLRIATAKQNQENRGASVTSQTGFRGVYKRPGGKYQAYVTHNYKRLSLGTYNSAEEANRVVIAKRLELYSHNQEDRSRHAG